MPIGSIANAVRCEQWGISLGAAGPIRKQFEEENLLAEIRVHTCNCHLQTLLSKTFLQLLPRIKPLSRPVSTSHTKGCTRRRRQKADSVN